MLKTQIQETGAAKAAIIGYMGHDAKEAQDENDSFHGISYGLGKHQEMEKPSTGIEDKPSDVLRILQKREGLVHE